MLALRARVAASGLDKTAPVLTSPTDTALSATTGRGTVATDEDNGTLFAVVTTSATKPSTAQLAAGQDHTGSAAAFDDSQAITSTGTKTFDATGLTQSTTYYFHFAQRDRAGNWSSVVSGNGFTTQSTDTTAPTLSNAQVNNVGETVCTVRVTTNEGSGESGDRVYWVISTSSTKPSKAQVKAGKTHTGANGVDADSWPAPIGGGAQNQGASGLTAATNYWAHFMHEDAAGNQSSVVSASFTTTGGGGGGGGGVTPGSQDFAVSGTFTVPNFNTLIVEVYGAGGGGGGGGVDSYNQAQSGGTSQFQTGESWLVATGGEGGKGAQWGGAIAAGGVASGGDTNTNGENGVQQAGGNSGRGGNAPGPDGGDGGAALSASPPYVGNAGSSHGGGGGGGRRNIPGGGGNGGGAGAYVKKTYTVGDLTVGASITVGVGTGGTGSNGYLGTQTKGGNGANGRVKISWT